MKRNILLLLATAVTMAATAQTRQLIPNDKVMIDGKLLPAIAKAPEVKLRGAATTGNVSRGKIAATWGGTTYTETILTEDFSGLTGGAEDEPAETPVCNLYSGLGWDINFDIDPSYTNTPGWTGNWVHPAGGTAALQDPYGYIGAYINTPEGDYSGDLTVTFRARAIGSHKGYLNVNFLKGSTSNPSLADTDDSESSAINSFNFYPGYGWVDVEIKFHNTSADNDGFIQFLCYGYAQLDDIKVTVTDNFIAPANVLEPTDFTKDGFTANWEPVRRAYDYWIWLYKKVYTSDEDAEYFTDFEDGQIPEWLDVSAGATVDDGVGQDSTKALALHEGDTLTTPYNMSKYKNAYFFIKVNLPEGMTTDDAYSAYVSLKVRGEEGWSSLGSFYISKYITQGFMVDMNYQTYDAFKKYYGLRIYPEGFSAGMTLTIDSLYLPTGRPAELIATSEEEEWGYPMDTKDSTAYIFTGLDSLTEYYYGIQSHFVYEYSKYTLHHAFGLAAPEVDTATNIDARGGYTANWKSAPKATSYTVTNYGLKTAKEDGQMTILDEDFSLINADVTDATDPENPENLGNSYEYVSFDGYTQQDGWTGVNNTIAQGYLGGAYGYYKGTVSTPTLDLRNADSFYLKVNAVGYYGESLQIVTPNATYVINFEADASDETGTYGIINNTYTVPEGGEFMSIGFNTYQGYPFMLDQITVSQDVKAGDMVYAELASATVGADTLSYRFTGLADLSGYDKFAYSVVAHQYLDGETADSNPSETVIVDLQNGSTVIDNVESIAQTSADVSYYTIDGQRRNALSKGINIVRMSNGTVKKIIVR